jgi:hypothetical protein
MTSSSGSTQPSLAPVWRLVWLIYILGCGVSFLYFNWSYAQQNGFTKWLLLGEIVPTAKAAIWPYLSYCQKVWK